MIEIKTTYGMLLVNNLSINRVLKAKDQDGVYSLSIFFNDKSQIEIIYKNRSGPSRVFSLEYFLDCDSEKNQDNSTTVINQLYEKLKNT